MIAVFLIDLVELSRPALRSHRPVETRKTGLSRQTEKNLVPLHEAVAFETLAAALLNLAESLFPLLASAIVFRPLEFESSMLFAKPANRRLFGEWIGKLHPDDVWLTRAPPAPKDTVVRHTDHTPDAVLVETLFYQSVMRPRNIRYGSAVLVWKRSQCQAIFFLVRSSRQGDFTDDEMERLQLVYPHIRAAVDRVFLIQEERGARRALTRAIASLPLAIVILSWDLCVIEHNLAATDACARWRNGDRHARLMNAPRRFSLPADLVKAVRGLKESIIAGETTLRQATRTVSHGKVPGLECSIRGVPIDPDTRPTFLCKIVNPENPVERAAIGLDKWQLVARLTPAERNLLPFLLEGAGNREIAAALGKSLATVRNQLHSIFGKLHITRREELITRLLT